MHIGQKNDNPAANKLAEDHHRAVLQSWADVHREHDEPRDWCEQCKEK